LYGGQKAMRRKHRDRDAEGVGEQGGYVLLHRRGNDFSVGEQKLNDFSTKSRSVFAPQPKNRSFSIEEEKNW